MVIITKCASVFFLGILELWAAVPTGLALKLSPVLTVAFSALGAATGAFIVLLVGEPLRKWLLTLRKSTSERSNGKLKRIWDRYGIPGLCLISPFLLGAHIGAAVGLTFGGRKAAIAVWMTISCFLWAAIFTALGTAGISVFHRG